MKRIEDELSKINYAIDRLESKNNELKNEREALDQHKEQYDKANKNLTCLKRDGNEYCIATNSELQAYIREKQGMYGIDDASNKLKPGSESFDEATRGNSIAYDNTILETKGSSGSPLVGTEELDFIAHLEQITNAPKEPLLNKNMRNWYNNNYTWSYYDESGPGGWPLPSFKSKEDLGEKMARINSIEALQPFLEEQRNEFLRFSYAVGYARYLQGKGPNGTLPDIPADITDAMKDHIATLKTIIDDVKARELAIEKCKVYELCGLEMPESQQVLKTQKIPQAPTPPTQPQSEPQTQRTNTFSVSSIITLFQKGGAKPELVKQYEGATRNLTRETRHKT